MSIHKLPLFDPTALHHTYIFFSKPGLEDLNHQCKDDVAPPSFWGEQYCNKHLYLYLHVLFLTIEHDRHRLRLRTCLCVVLVTISLIRYEIYVCNGFALGSLWWLVWRGGSFFVSDTICVLSPPSHYQLPYVLCLQIKYKTSYSFLTTML